MVDRVIFVLVFASAIGCGLIAGAFFAFSTFVMRALGRIPAAQGIAAMQSINVVVINPIFLGVFLGTAGACALLAGSAAVAWHSVCALVGSLVYLVGTFGVTMVFNVPRNNTLARIDPASAEAELVWRRYVREWTAWNHVRTVAAVGAAALLIGALCLKRVGS